MELTNKQKHMIDYIRGTRATAPPEVADAHADYYDVWVSGEKVAIGDRRRDPDDDLLYEVHAAAGDNLYPPHEVPAVWKRVYTEEWPEWVQPLGTHDVYAKGAKVTHKSKKWISDVPDNVWEPGIYGWTEYAE